MTGKTPKSPDGHAQKQCRGSASSSKCSGSNNGYCPPGSCKKKDKNCPPGLEHLKSMDEVLIRQQSHLAEAIGCWESSNKYSITNASGQELYHAAEDSNVLCRQCCTDRRSFHIHITDNSGKEILTVKRPFKCSTGFTSWFACCDPCQDTIQVVTGDGKFLGSVREACSVWNPHYMIYDENGTSSYEIWGPCCACTCRCFRGQAPFTVKKVDNGTEVAQIKKVWSGAMKEMFTDSDCFGASFIKDLDVKTKAVILGAVFIIDYMYFES